MNFFARFLCHFETAMNKKYRIFILLFSWSLIICLSTLANSQGIGANYANVTDSYLSVDFSKISTHTIVIGAGVSDWQGTRPSRENTWSYDAGEYIWLDKIGDDTGDGDYVYPSNSAFLDSEGNDTTADIEEVRITLDSEESVCLLIKTHQPCAEFWPIAFIIGIDIGIPDAGMEVFVEGDGSDADTGPSVELRSTAIRCDYLLMIDAGYIARIWDVYGNKIGDCNSSSDDGTLDNIEYDDYSWQYHEVKIPKTLIGTPGNSTWNFIIGSGFQEDHMFREVQPHAAEGNTEFYFTNGDSSWWDNTGPDPDVVDLCGAEQSIQEAELASYISTFYYNTENLEGLSVGIRPNPFNPESDDPEIYYSLSQEAYVTIKIFSMSGELITTVIDNAKRQPSESPQFFAEKWNGCNNSGEVLKNGIYIYQVKFRNSNEEVITTKVFRIWK
jgi:hypothetical protein